MLKDHSADSVKAECIRKNELRMIGRRIRNTRLERGLSQSELAAQVGVSEQCISYIERGTREPYALNLLKIAQELSCSTDYLLRGSIHSCDVFVFFSRLGRIDPERINDFFSAVEKFSR